MAKNEVENIDFAFKIFNQTNIVFKKNPSKKSQIIFSVLPPNLEDGVWAEVIKEEKPTQEEIDRVLDYLKNKNNS